MIILKQIYVHNGRKFEALTIRNYNETDIKGLISLQRECFPPPFPQELLWSESQLDSHIKTFPEGALCRAHQWQNYWFHDGSYCTI
ncbi:acetyltransferase [Bacillus sp. FW1]|nr:acetyltransferase [Bacillus sp. FW1]